MFGFACSLTSEYFGLAWLGHWYAGNSDGECLQHGGAVRCGAVLQRLQQQLQLHERTSARRRAHLQRQISENEGGRQLGVWRGGQGGGESTDRLLGGLAGSVTMCGLICICGTAGKVIQVFFF